MADQIVLDFVLRARDQGVAGASAAVDQLNKEYEQNQKATAKASAGQQQFAGSLQMSEAQMSRLRYANYDLSRTMLTMSAAVAAAGVATLAAFAAQESAFTEVERILHTNGESVGSLRQDLIDLSTQIPMSFQDLSSIAAIGAALDIASDDLADFASVVGRTAAVTGASTEEVGTAIARLQQYTGAGFEELSSAILTAGNISIATEKDVIRFSQALALPGAQADFTAEQIIGLAAATASFANINTQGAGTAFARTLDVIGEAASNGGERLEFLAELAGTTAGEFQRGWLDGNTSELFNKVMSGLSEDVNGLSANMDELGFAEKRQRRVISGLAQNWSTVSPILDTTGDALAEGTALSQAYGFTLDDLSTRFSTFVNSAMNAASAVGGALAPAVIGVLGPLQEFLSFLTDFASTGFGQTMISVVGGITAAVGAMALLRGGTALATAGVLAYRQAVMGTVAANAGLAGQIRLLGGLFTGAGVQAGAAATGVTAVGVASQGAQGKMAGFRSVAGGIVNFLGGPWLLAFAGAATAAGLVVQKLNEMDEIQIDTVRDTLLETDRASTALRKSMEVNGITTRSAADAWAQFTGEMELVPGQLTNAEQGLMGVSEAEIESANTANRLGESLEDLGDAWTTQTDNMPAVRTAFADLVHVMGVSKDQLPELLRLLGPDFNDALNQHLEASDQATTAQNRLALVFGETDQNARLAEEGIGGAMTATQEAQLAAEAAQDAYDSLKDSFLNFNQATITAHDDVLALKLGMNGLQTEASELEGGMFDGSDAALKFQQSVSQVNDQLMQSTISTLENGEATDKTRESLIKGRKAIIDTIAPFFESRAAAKKWYEGIYGDTNAAVRQLEATEEAADDLNKEVTTEVDADTSDADQKLSAAERRLRAIDQQQVTAHVRASYDFSGVYAALAALRRAAQSAGTVHTSGPSLAYASGGYTGRGGKYQPAGIVHKGEYVVPKHMVNQATGLPKADAMGKLTRGEASPAGYANGGYVSTPAFPSTMALSPGTIMQLANAVRTQILIDGEAVGRAASRNAIRANSKGEL